MSALRGETAPRGECAPRGDPRGDLPGEFLGEAPPLPGEGRRPGDPRNEGRVLGETERSLPPGDLESDLPREEEREREVGVPSTRRRRGDEPPNLLR